jgi:hypothetical protein
MKTLPFKKTTLLFFSIAAFSFTAISCADNDGTNAEICDNGIDDDDDGFIDCEDASCDGAAVCL